MKPTEVIGRIAQNECAGAQLLETEMLLAMWSTDDTTYIKYPSAEQSSIEPKTPVQIGTLTTSFLVPRLLKELAGAGLTIDSVAIPVRSKGSGAFIRDITYKQLLTHTSNLPVHTASGTGTALDHLLALDDKLKVQDSNEIDGSYRFTHWNYTLAAEAISSRLSGMPALRVKPLAYNDQLPDSIRNAMAVSKAKLTTPQENQHPDLFALSTAGVASTHQLIGLLDSLAQQDLSNPILVPTLPSRPNTKATLGWHVLELKNGNRVYVSSGQTRRYGAAVAYYPATKTGVTAVATDSKRLDCLVVDVLRNMNLDWKRTTAVFE